MTDLPCNAWVALDLAAATFLSDGGGDPLGEFSGDVIWGTSGPNFWFDIALDPTKAYAFEITFAPASSHDGGNRFVGLWATRPGHEQEDFDPFNVAGLYSNAHPVSADVGDVVTFTVGPDLTRVDGGSVFSGIPDWDDPIGGIVAGWTRPFIENTIDSAVSAVRVMKMCATDSPLPPVESPAPGGAGDQAFPDGLGPIDVDEGGGAPTAGTIPAGGGYLTTGARRQSPTRAQVVIDGRWLTGVCPWGDLAWSHVWPGGSGNASWTATRIPANLTRRGATVELMFGMETIWSGVLSQPDPSGESMNAVGLWTVGVNWTALDGSGDTSVIPDEAIDAAIDLGMPWKRRDSISTDPVDIDTSQGPVTIGALLDAYADTATQRWGVTPDGYVVSTGEPTSPAYHVLPLESGLTPTDDFASALVGRYYNGSTYETVIVTGSQSNGYQEAIVDLTPRGTLTLTKATNLLTSLLNKGRGKPTFATPIACGYGDILSNGQVPVGLERPVAGDLVRVHGLIDDTHANGGRMYLDVLIGQTDVADDTLTLTPMGKPARTLVDLLALAAQSKKGAA
jgi:hypothetical protein